MSTQLSRSYVQRSVRCCCACLAPFNRLRERGAAAWWRVHAGLAFVQHARERCQASYLSGACAAAAAVARPPRAQETRFVMAERRRCRAQRPCRTRLTARGSGASNSHFRVPPPAPPCPPHALLVPLLTLFPCLPFANAPAFRRFFCCRLFHCRNVAASVAAPPVAALPSVALPVGPPPYHTPLSPPCCCCC
jgi:hypothetical protein